MTDEILNRISISLTFRMTEYGYSEEDFAAKVAEAKQPDGQFHVCSNWEND